MKEPLDEVMVSGISRFALRALQDSRLERNQRWARDFKNPQADEKSVEAKRERLRTIVGAVDKRELADGFELVAKVGHDGVVARGATFVIYAVRWRVLDGVTAEGLLLMPNDRPIARVVALPDADWTPEVFVGVVAGLGNHTATPAQLATNRIQVVVPTLISREDTYSGNPAIAFTNQPHREFIYRQAFQMGRHIIGYEVDKVTAAVDQFEQLNHREHVDLPIGVIGVGEGGLLALYSSAIDTRIDATMVSGYFQTRERIWEEPIYRNVWGLLTEFGDAEIASLIAPRSLIIEACAVPEVTGPPAPHDGRRNCAAPGRIKSCSLDNVRSEFDRAKSYFDRLGAGKQISLVVSANGSGPSGSAESIATFVENFGIHDSWSNSQDKLQLANDLIDPKIRQRRQVQDLVEYTQRLMRLSPKVRDAFWSKADRSNPETWHRSTEYYRNYVWEEMIGKLPSPNIPLNARTRPALDAPEYSSYDVVMDVYPDVIAAGILLLPKNLKPAEKRPVVICQHGLEGVPFDTIADNGQAFRYYKSFAAELAKRGFIVYAPQNPYRGGDRFRVLQRQSNPLKLSLFSYIIRQHERTLEWLASLPSVDAERIGFYGLSYGGKTAMRVPPLLDQKFSVCICSADFNDWITKIATVDDAHGYIFTGEYEMPEWNMAHVASYAELANLMAPRAFMVERGHEDGVAPDEWVAGEYAKVRRHYAKLSMDDQTTIEFFNGPHTIHGVGTYEFLHKHLNWSADP